MVIRQLTLFSANLNCYVKAKEKLQGCTVTYNKQLLDKVFAISRIIKVEVSVISLAEGRG